MNLNDMALPVFLGALLSGCSATAPVVQGKIGIDSHFAANFSLMSWKNETGNEWSAACVKSLASVRSDLLEVTGTTTMMYRPQTTITVGGRTDKLRPGEAPSKDQQMVLDAADQVTGQPVSTIATPKDWSWTSGQWLLKKLGLPASSDIGKATLILEPRFKKLENCNSEAPGWSSPKTVFLCQLTVVAYRGDVTKTLGEVAGEYSSKTYPEFYEFGTPHRDSTELVETCVKAVLKKVVSDYNNLPRDF